MSKPQNEPGDKEYFKDIHFLYEIFNELKSVEEIKAFLKDILSSSELRMIKKRWHIASLLRTGLDIRTVAQETQSSTQTVGKIKRILEEGYGGLKYAIGKMNNNIKKDNKKGRKSQGSMHVKSWLDINK